MNRPNKPARWQLDVWIVLMIALAVLMMRAPIPHGWVTLVQIGWCVLTMGGMGVWVWINRAALGQEDQEQQSNDQQSAADSKQPLARTLPLTPVQQHFLEATGQSVGRTKAAPQPAAPASPRARENRKRNSPTNAHTAGAHHMCANGSVPTSIRCRFSLTLIVYASTALTMAGALLFLVLVGEFITPFWSRVALVLYGLGLALALGIVRYRPSWRLLLYPLVLIALIYVWDSTLPPPSLPTGRVRLLLPLLALGWMVVDGAVRLWQRIRRAL